METNTKNKEIENNIKEKELDVNTKNLNETQPPEPKKKNVFKKTFGIIGKIIGWTTIIFLILILVRALVFKKYDVFGYRFYLIMSGSMEPTIHVSDGIITKEIQDPQDGDIIAFNNQGAITVHRIIKTYKQENGEKLYQTKGDNNNGADRGLVSKSQIKGKVILRIPKVGKTIIFLQKHIVIILILMVGVVAIIYLVRRLI